MCVKCVEAQVGAGGGLSWEWAADSATNGAFVYLHCSASPHPASLPLPFPLSLVFTTRAHTKHTERKAGHRRLETYTKASFE